MKTNLLKSIFISLILVMGVTQIGAANITSDGTARLYFKMSAVSWWIAGNSGDGNFAYFYGSSGNKWSAHSVNHSGNDYYVVIPAGTWDHVILTRNNTSTSPSWDNKWNQTGNIALSSSSNYLSKFSADSESVTWGTAIKPTSTASVASSAASVFVGAPANLTASLTSNADINTVKSVTYSTTTGASISGSTFTATAAGEYTVTATVTYHPNGYPSITSTATATTTITAEVPAEETNEVSVTYMCDATEVSSAIAEIVGVETEKSFTAPTVTGYNFTGWTIGAGITLKAGTASDATITVVTKSAASDYTLVANYKEVQETVYFINAGKWSKVHLHLWNGNAVGTEWPGTQLTATGEKIGEYDVYSYTAKQGDHLNLLFHENTGDVNKTTDLTWAEGVDKYYIHNYNGNTGWYTQSDAEELLVVPVVYETVYFVNNKNWSLVQIHAWKDAANNGWPGQALTATGEKVEGFDVYSFEAAQGTYTNLIFNNKEGDAGEQSENYVWTADKYYYMGAAENYAGGTKEEVAVLVAPDPLATEVYLAGDMTNKDNWDVNKKEFRKATNDATIASVTVTLAAQTYKFKLVVGGAWKGNTGTMQRGGDAVHEGGWSFDKDGYDDNCQIVADIAGDYTFTWDLNTKKLTVAYPPLPKHQVNATVNPAETGTVTGMGEYEEGSTATLVAAPAANYAFKNWTEGGEVVSTEATYSFKVTKAVELVANFVPEETHEVTISYLCNSNPIPGHGATTLAVGVTTPSTITAPAITHYTFDSWTVGSGVQAVDATKNPIDITTLGTGEYTLAANYTKIELTYNVQVPDGTEKCFIAGSMNGWSFTEMTKIDDTHYTITIDGATKEMEYKYACQASWDYEELQANGSSVSNRKWSAKDVVAKWKDPLATDIYLVGSMNSWNTTAHEFKKLSTEDTIASVTLKNLGKDTYQFKIIDDGIWLGNTGTMKRGGTGVHEGGWIFENLVGGDETNCKLVADIDGEYTFTWNINAKKLTVTYPTKDYRLVYVESASGGAPYTKFRASQPIHYQIEGEKRDTISFYIKKEGQNPAILLQQCEVDNGSATWNTIATQSINGVQAGDPRQAKAPTKRSPELKIGNGFPNIESSGVYNFVLEQTNNNAEHNAQILSQETHAYVGNYYIRTDAAEGGWNNYKTTPNNIMTYSQNVHGNYNYYFCAWVLKDQNVKYVVANDYSYCVSDTLADDDIVTNIYGNLPANANVRYTWNSQTNALERAYLAGSGNISDRYLVLIGDDNLKDLEGNTFNIGDLNPNEANFKDMDNWLYQLDIKANKNTLVKLTADYNGKTQYFNNKGSADSTKQLIKGNDTTYYALRLIYDFKTNYLVSGLVGNQTITSDLELEEVMIVRSHHDEAQTLKISNGRVTANKAYGVMTFNKDTLNDNTKSQYERALYWVSFPFDVQLDKVFGFGNYGEHWIMEYYDGAERAEKGLWKEPTYSYWKYITNPNDTLEAGKGYVLCLNLDLLDNSTAFWDHGNTEIALYFPSDGQNAIVIDNNPAETTTKVDAHTCTIERDDRDIEDSNWNIIGVPAYTKIAEINSQNLNFYYQYIAGDDPETEDIDETNSYRVQDEPTFNTMHAYMVQFAGEINWMEKVVSLAAIAARKSPTNKDQYTLRLALQQEGADHDHTFIRLQEDKATAEFDMNYDLCKIINSGANIYSMIGNVEVAANVLPMEERVIPLGLDIHETGNYTFAMPDGTDGITAILIDYETGKETNLLLADYTTELREGTNNGRFALRVRPNHVATEVETIIDGANGQIQKYIINGALYILNNGQLYDAQGRMVQP